MSKRKPGISLERHAEIGAEMARVHDWLVELSCEIANAYPRDQKVVRAAHRLGSLNARPSDLDHLRSELENAMYAEHGGPGRLGFDDPPGCSPAVYYPAPEDREAQS